MDEKRTLYDLLVEKYVALPIAYKPYRDDYKRIKIMSFSSFLIILTILIVMTIPLILNFYSSIVFWFGVICIAILIFQSGYYMMVDSDKIFKKHFKIKRLK